MLLIELAANKPSFHTVKFNPTGLTIIVGEKHDPTKKGGDKTYNSVGKSLIIALIHFCLGSKNIPAFQSKLKDWIFCLKFSINGEIHVVKRETNTQNFVILDDQKVTLAVYKEFLLKNCFMIVKNTPYLTWRSLIQRFIRRSKTSYTEYDSYVKKESPYSQLLNNAFLLGLDIDLIKQKYEYIGILREAETHKKSLEKDPIFKSYFIEEGKDVDIEIAELEKKISFLQDNIDKFNVAENYGTIKIQANEYSEYQKDLLNQISILQNAVANIEKSLTLQTDISIKKVQELYTSVGITLPEMLKIPLQEVEEFHKQITIKRSERLREDKNNLQKKISILNKKKESIDLDLNKYFSFLDSHGALGELVSLSRELTHMINKCEKLKGFKEILRKYSDKIQEIKGLLIDSNLETSHYLNDNEEIIKNISSQFRIIAKMFYNNKASGIKTTNNTKDNNLRFEIEAKIEDDNGDGINEVKIFCFDFTVFLISQTKHKIKFIFHDSRILSNMDVRQRAILLKMAKSLSELHKMQYIISINQDTVNSIREEMSEEPGKFNSIFNEDTITLHLTDRSVESKLLGIQVDLKYE